MLLRHSVHFQTMYHSQHSLIQNCWPLLLLRADYSSKDFKIVVILSFDIGSRESFEIVTRHASYFEAFICSLGKTTRTTA